MLTWRPATPDANHFLDLSKLFPAADWVSAYALTRIYAPEDQDVILTLTAVDDWLRLWLNGNLVHEQSLSRVPRSVPIHLAAGWNTLLAKVSNAKSTYGLGSKLSAAPGRSRRGS